MTELSITVYGTPAPQGSKRAFVGKSGRAHVIESSHDRVKSWRAAVIDAALEVCPAAPLAGPLLASVTFYVARPRSHYGTGRNAAASGGSRRFAWPNCTMSAAVSSSTSARWRPGKFSSKTQTMRP